MAGHCIVNSPGLTRFSSSSLFCNARREHFWLNEGWTMWLERRILARLYGEEVGWMMGPAW